MGVKRGIVVWIFAFATFLAIVFSFAMVLLVNEDADAIVSPYLIGNIFGNLSAESYLWISVTTTFIFLGLTCIIAYRKQPPDPEIVKMFLKVGGNLNAIRKAQEASANQIADQIEFNRKANQRSFRNINTNIEEANKETLSILTNQVEAVKKTRRDLISKIEEKADETTKKLYDDLKKQETNIVGVKRLTEESTAVLKKQTVELEEIELRLGRIEGNIAPTQAKLKSIDNPKNIKGIGPSFEQELSNLGITTVGEFLTTDPLLIGEKTRLSQEVAENLQAMAQLMMIPGIDTTDAELLIEAGIRSRQELADQDLIQLSRKVNDIAKIYVDQEKISKDELPTIETISSWIRMAR